MPEELVIKQKWGNTWTASFQAGGVTIKRTSKGYKQPYTVEGSFTWEQWERVIAWVAFQHASKGVRLDT